MAATTVRIEEDDYEMLRCVADEREQPIKRVLHELIEAYRRHRLVAATNADYARLRSDPDAWAAELAEREGWDAAVRDGLEGAEHAESAVATTRRGVGRQPRSRHRPRARRA